MSILPTYEESRAAVYDLTATPLQKFIYSYTPPLTMSIQEWRDELGATIAAETERANSKAHYVSSLLAVIHRDGGHYEQEHGTEKAVADALLLIPTERGISEELIAAAELRGFERAKGAIEDCRTAIIDEYPHDAGVVGVCGELVTRLILMHKQPQPAQEKAAE